VTTINSDTECLASEEDLNAANSIIEEAI